MLVMTVERVLKELDSQGWSKFPIGSCEISKLISNLGHIIMENDVRIVKTSPALVTSSEGLPPHTDHHLSQYIMWHCVTQDSQGGHSIIVDGLHIFRTMPSEVREVLRSIRLKEHTVFKGDVGHHPLIYGIGAGERLYYPVLFEPTEFWLANDLFSNEQRMAFDAFNKAVKEAVPVCIKLNPDECLVVDNGRILHGRTAIHEKSDRLLKRYWIGKTPC